jgi:hypothetical protein
MKLSTSQKDALLMAYGYLIKIVELQGFLPSIEDCYGDGTRFGLTKEGFKIPYEQVKADIALLIKHKIGK